MRDKCTLYCDRNLIRRNNVVSEVKKRFSACKSFLHLELHARIVACTLSILGMEKCDDVPSEDVLPSSLQNASKSHREMFAQKLAAKVVDKFVTNKKSLDSFLNQKSKANESITYKCRSPGCTREFKVDGKQKKNHEFKIHGLDPIVRESESEAETDDMYNYQVSFLEYGMIVKNFSDAVKEGDGERIIQNWKFLLPYLKANGAASRKYALEGFHLLAQVHCLLTQRDAHRLIWNRSVKSKNGPGGNIPMDLGMEHYIKIMKIIIRNLGSDACNVKIHNRYAKALSFNKKVVDNFDSMSLIINRSGKHVKKLAQKDMRKIVCELVDQKAFLFTLGRSYKHCKAMPNSLLHGFQICSLYQWIQEHKRKILDRQKAW